MEAHRPWQVHLSQPAQENSEWGSLRLVMMMKMTKYHATISNQCTLYSTAVAYQDVFTQPKAFHFMAQASGYLGNI